MRQPIMLSHLFPTFCSFGRQNLFHEKVSPFQDFVIPALDQETYGEFLQWCPGLGVFTLERFSCTEEDSRVSIQSTKIESELLECLEQKISPVPTKETGAIPKIKVAAANPKLERGPKKETGGTPKLKLPRSLACILDFYMQEDNMGDEKPSTPRRRDWYQKSVFPIIDSSDNSSSPTKTITRQIDPLYIDLENEESTGPPRHDCYKTNIFSSMAHNSISPPTTKIMMGQIDPF